MSRFTQVLVDFGVWILDWMGSGPAAQPQPVRVRRLMLGLLAGCLSASCLTAASFAEPLPPEEDVHYKTVTGQVSGVGPQFIAVEYQRNAEMAFPLDEKAKLQRIKSLKELQLGDTVDVEYRESSFKDEHKQVRTTRRATRVALVKKAPLQPTVVEPEEPEAQ